MSLRVRLDLDDVAACLWAWLDRGCTVDDLADDAAVRELVVEAVVNRGLSEVTGYRDEVTATPRGTNLVIDACRDAAARLFAPATTVPAPLPALALAGSGR